MKLKDMSEEELYALSYDEIAYLILTEAGKKMKLLDLFKKVCKLLGDDFEEKQDKIGDFFEILSVNKKFVLLKNGFWDIATRHKQDIVVEDEDEISSEETEDEEEVIEEEIEDEEEDIFYDSDNLEDDDIEEDELKDLVIVDEEESDN